MITELEEVKKKIGHNFLKKIDKYKKQNNISYNQIADLVGINKFYFANLRNKIKKENQIPSEKILKKFEKLGIY